MLEELTLEKEVRFIRGARGAAASHSPRPYGSMIRDRAVISRIPRAVTKLSSLDWRDADKDEERFG